MNMTEITVECIPFKKGILSQEELNQFRENIGEDYELELKKEIQYIFKFGGIEISLNELFNE